MLNTEMLARLRVFLDEASTDLFNDTTELYPALSLAQLELVKDIANFWDINKRKAMIEVPLTIRDLVTSDSATIASGSNSFAKTDVIMPMAMKWNPAGAVADGKYCTYTVGEIRKMLENRFLAVGYYFWLRSGIVFVNPVSTDASAGYSFEYIDTPVDITSSVQPVTQEVGHDAIVERACWVLLKDRESEQANIHLQMYGTLLKGLV